MNSGSENKPVTWLFNPFFYIAGGKALVLGLAMILLAGVIGMLSNTHFDGVLDTHTGTRVPFWLFLAEGFIDWLCLALVLLAVGKLASKTSFRAIDVLGTQALARWPTILMAFLLMPDAMRRVGAELMEALAKPGGRPMLSPVDLIVFCIVILASIPVLCWTIYLMYKSYSVSCNLKGAKAIGTFVAGLIAAEVLSKVCMGLLFAPVLLGATFTAPAPVATPVLESNQTTTAQNGVADMGVQFVNMLGAENFDGAFARFDATMVKVFPEAQLREFWKDLVKKYGPFQKPLTTRTSEQAGYRVVLVTCQFEHGKLDFKVVFNTANQVSGLFYFPSESK